MARPRGDIQPRILHAARARFLTEGVDGASLRRIAEEAGTSIGMVYYYFPTKDDLFLAVVEEIYVSLLADLERALAPERSVPERLAALYTRFGALTAEEVLIGRIILREALASPARLDSLVLRFRRGHVPLLLALVRDGFGQGVFRPDLPAAEVLVSMMLLAGPAQALIHLVAARFQLGPAPDAARLAEDMVATFLRGVAAPAKDRR